MNGRGGGLRVAARVGTTMSVPVSAGVHPKKVGTGFIVKNRVVARSRCAIVCVCLCVCVCV